MMTLVLVWATFGLSWNVLSGYTGLVSFGHAAFFGIGAYTTALGQIHFDLTPWLLIPVAAVFGAVAGLLIGFPTFRLRGVYFALSMLAYPLALLYVFEWLGYQEVTLPMKRETPAAYMQFSDHRIYTLLALALLSVIVLVTRMVEQSRFGMALLVDQAERGGGGGGRHRHTEVEALCHHAQRCHRRGRRRLLRGGAAGGDAGLGVRHAGVGASPDGHPVRRRGNGVGPGDRRRHPHPHGRDPPRRARPYHSRHPERHLRSRHRGADPGGAGRHVLEGARLRLPPLAAPGSGAAGCDGAAKRPLRRLEQRHAGRPRAGAIVRRGPLLSVRGLSVSFGGLKAVQDVSFDVARGTILGIIGPNGAGKTTVFNLLNGFLRPDAGQIVFDGRNVTRRKPHQLCAAGVGRTFQIMRPFARMSVADNVVIGAYVRAATDAEARRLAADAHGPCRPRRLRAPHRRRADDARAAADGAGARARRPAHAAAARRDAWPGSATARPTS